MTVEELISELEKCNPEHNVDFCNVQKLSDAETEIDEGETWIVTNGSIETVSRHERGVYLAFVEE